MEQRKLSRKYESLKIRNKNIKEGRATRQNIQKQVVKVQKLHQRLRNIRTDYINKTVFSIIKQKRECREICVKTNFPTVFLNT